MKRLVHTLALGAALVALSLGVWRDYGAFTAVKRAAMSYLVAYFLAGGLGVAARAALWASRDPEPEPEPAETSKKPRRRRRRQPRIDAEQAPPVGEAAGEAADAMVEPQPQPVSAG